MPAVSHAKTPCIARLATELGYASKPTLLRHLARIDELAPQIDPDGVYPQDWIVFRITGYRPDIPAPALIPGQALRADLSAVAESISEAAGITLDDLDQPHETIDSLCARWGVSRKTIERYRRLGLVARRIDLGGGRRRVVFMRSAVEWFETLHAARLGEAGRFDRIPDSELERFARWARGYRRRLGWSRSRSAARIAARSGRSHEGVRKALIRIDEQLDAPIFDGAGPTTGRDQMLALRAVGRGIEPGDIAHRTGRSRSAVLRAINAARAGLLASCELPGAGEAERADEPGLVGSAVVSTGIGGRGPTDLHALIGAMRVRVVTIAYEEQRRAAALRLLVRRAGTRFAMLDASSPSARALDEIETDLRRASMLKIELVRSQLNLVLSTIEHRLGGLIDTLAPNRAAFLLLGAVGVACDAIDRFDPARAGRLAAPVGLAVTRFASRCADVAQPASTGKAMRRIPLGHEIDDWTRRVHPWDRWLLLDRRVEVVVEGPGEGPGELPGERDRLILTRRFGLDGLPPMTRREIAGLLGTSATHAAVFERRAIRACLRLARGE